MPLFSHFLFRFIHASPGRRLISSIWYISCACLSVCWFYRPTLFKILGKTRLKNATNHLRKNVLFSVFKRGFFQKKMQQYIFQFCICWKQHTLCYGSSGWIPRKKTLKYKIICFWAFSNAKMGSKKVGCGCVHITSTWCACVNAIFFGETHAIQPHHENKRGVRYNFDSLGSMSLKVKLFISKLENHIPSHSKHTHIVVPAHHHTPLTHLKTRLQHMFKDK